MAMELATTPWSEAAADWLIVPMTKSPQLTGALASLDESLGGAVGRLIESGDVSGKPAERVTIPDAPGIAAGRVLLVGLGDVETLNPTILHKALMSAARQTSGKENRTVAVAIPEGLTATDVACEIAASFTVGCVGQDLYRAERAHHPFQSVTILGSADADQGELASAVERGSILGEAVNITRDLVNRPAYEVYPASFAKRAEALANDHGLKCEVLDKKRLQKERMGAILAVAAGSEKGPRVVVLEHRGGGDDAPTLALVGKGVTFDSGGLSLKTSEGMKTMKCDMAGAATVLGAMTAIARLNLPVNITGYMGLTENMVSGSSYKLGDVLTARNGVTIEVLNTDAEGRLVLADVLSYAVDKGADRIIDLATLTGACVVALGEEVTGAFANDQPWCDEVLSAAKTCGEDAWQMPMFDLFDDLIKSDVSDIKNIGGRWGGAITAAKFLQRFVGDKPWVHLDIAGPAFASSNKSHREGGATGCMVHTLVETAAQFGNGG
jgi:leucyl aminopeptidase